MDTKYFRYKNFQLHFHKIGSGDAVWFTFHGFGQNHAVFHYMAGSFKNNNAIYNFDLIFHGGSHYYAKTPIQKAEWVETINYFLDFHQIKKISLAGFSIGCRLLIPLIEAIPEKIEKVVFMAPDGIAYNFWYRLATKPLFRGFLKYTVFKPRLFFYLAFLYKKFSIADKSLVRFAKSQMNDREQRWRVYKTWVFFRKLKVSSKMLAKTLNNFNVSVVIVLARQDRIVDQRSLQKFMDQLQNCSLVIIDTTHQKLIEKAADAIKIYL